MKALKSLFLTRPGLVLSLMLGMILALWSGQSIAARYIEDSPAAQPSQAQSNTQADKMGQSTTPLKSVLNNDGTLNLDTGFSGSLNAKGWQMQTGADGKPHFVQVDSASKETKAQPQQPSVPGDENWDNRFAVGTNNNVLAVAVSGTDVYMGGFFTTAGGVPANNIAKWNSSTNTWSALGSGTDSDVYAITVSGADVYVGGFFATAGGVPASRIARWNSSTSTWSALGSGVNDGGVVHAIAISGVNVYVGGFFHTAGGVSANNIAKWNSSTSTWSALGSGTSGDPGFVDVRAVAVSGTDVYVGGYFTLAGGIPANRIARWDSITSTWSALGSGVNSVVFAIAVSGADVYVGGLFTTAGGAPANRIARWNSSTSTWSALGSGADNIVQAIAVIGPDVYVGGGFATAGGVPASCIAKWDSSTSTWSPLGSGTNFIIYAIAVSGADVNVGGQFTQAGGIGSNHFGIWHIPCPVSPNYTVTSTTGATIVPATTYVPGSTCNSCTVNIPLPFTYTFYGTPYTSVNGSNKGNLQFGSSNSSGANTCLPNASMTNTIFAYWDDINTNINDSMGIFTSVSGTAPNRIFNIRWSGGFEANDARVAFEVRLYEGQPKFDIIYGQTRGGGFSTTVGVQEGTGANFTQYACNSTNSVPTGTMLTFDQRVCP